MSEATTSRQPSPSDGVVDEKRTSITRKLLLALAVPVLFVAAISGVQAYRAQSDLNSTKDQVQLALAAGGPSTYVTALMDERNITALYLLGFSQPPGGGKDLVTLNRAPNMKVARQNTDKASKEFEASLGNSTSLRALFEPTLEKIGVALTKARKEVDDSKAPRDNKNVLAATNYDEYSSVIGDFHTTLATTVAKIDDARLHNRADSIAQQTRAADLLSLMVRTVSLSLIQTPTTADRFQAAQQLKWYDLARTQAARDVADDPVAYKTVTGFFGRASMNKFHDIIEGYAKGDTPPGPKEIIDMMNSAANPTEHPTDTEAWQAVRTSLQNRGSQLVDAAQNSRNLYVAVFLIATGLSILVALLIARSIARPLMSIADQAGEMASHTLPDAVGSILATPIGQDVVIPQLEPIVVTSRDEVADVARSINNVQQTALDLAAEQAAQRRNFADTFLNLGRRVQGLVARQLEFITDLEDGEQDAETLSNLFKLDHLATRIRRNAESLVVLAGVTRRGRGGDPAPVIDALRSALSEVDQYTRVSIGAVDSARLPLSVAADVSHILAELIENGLNFSPPESDVEVTGARSPEGYLITVTDHGIGMNADQVDTANRRLSGNESFTVAPSRYMGHFVAGHLATGLGIDVRIASSSDGTVATVLIGNELLVPDQRVEEPEAPDETVSVTHDDERQEEGSDGAETGPRPTFTPAAPPRAPQETSLSDLLSIHRRLSGDRSPDDE